MPASFTLLAGNIILDRKRSDAWTDFMALAIRHTHNSNRSRRYFDLQHEDAGSP